MKKNAKPKAPKVLKLTKQTIKNLTVKNPLNGDFPCWCESDS